MQSLRRCGQEVLTDERILGTDDFVERMLGEADPKARRLFSSRLRDKEVLVKGSGNGNKVFLLTPFHQIVSHILYSSGLFHIPFHQTLYFNYCLANGHRLPLKMSRNVLD